MNFGKKLTLYAIGNVASKLVSIALLPIYTRYIETNDYGRADIANSAVTLIVSIVFIEIWTGLLRYLFEDKYNDENKTRIFTNVFTLILILIIPFCIVQAFTNYILNTGFIIASIIYGLSLLMNQVYQFMARGNGKNQIFMFSGVIASVVQIIVAVIAIYIFHIDATVTLLAPSIGYMVSLIYIQMRCHYSQYINFKFVQKAYIKKLFVFSIPLALNSAAFWIIANFNRYYIAYAMGFDYSSYVAIAGKFTMVVSLAGMVFTLAWQESAYENSNLENRDLYYSEMFKIYLILSTILTALCLPVSKLLFPFMIGKDYQDAIILLVPYFIATLLSGLSTFLAQLFGAEKRTGKLMISTLTGSITNVVLMLLLAPTLGIISAPICLVFGYFVNVINRFFNIRKVVNLNIDKVVLIKSILILSLAGISFYVCDGTGLLIFALILLCVLIILLFFDIIKKMIVAMAILPKHSN